MTPWNLCATAKAVIAINYITIPILYVDGFEKPHNQLYARSNI